MMKPIAQNTLSLIEEIYVNTRQELISLKKFYNIFRIVQIEIGLAIDDICATLLDLRNSLQLLKSFPQIDSLLV